VGHVSVRLAPPPSATSRRRAGPRETAKPEKPERDLSRDLANHRQPRSRCVNPGNPMDAWRTETCPPRAGATTHPMPAIPIDLTDQARIWSTQSPTNAGRGRVTSLRFAVADVSPEDVMRTKLDSGTREARAPSARAKRAWSGATSRPRARRRRTAYRARRWLFRSQRGRARRGCGPARGRTSRRVRPLAAETPWP